MPFTPTHIAAVLPVAAVVGRALPFSALVIGSMLAMVLLALELSAALHLMAPRDDGWVTPVLTCSAAEHIDLDTVWDQLRAHRRLLERSGRLDEHRRAQDVRWMWSTIDDRLLSRFRTATRGRASEVEDQVRRGEITPTRAAETLLDDAP